MISVVTAIGSREGEAEGGETALSRLSRNRSLDLLPFRNKILGTGKRF